MFNEGFGLEEVSLTTLLELAELKPNADNLVNLDCDGDKNSSLCLPIITCYAVMETTTVNARSVTEQIQSLWICSVTDLAFQLNIFMSQA
jgi:hypothetical protein